MTPAPRRALRVLPWLLAACAAGVGLFVALPGSPVDRPWWRLPLVAIALVATPVAWKVNRMPWLVLAAFAAAALRLGARPIGIRDQASGLTWQAAIDDAVLGIVLVAAIVVAVCKRKGSFELPRTLDGVMVAISAGLVAWLLVANPLITDHGVAPPLALLASVYLPTAALVAVFTVDLALLGLMRHRGIWLLSAAVVANLVAALVGAFDLDSVGGDVNQVTTGLSIAAFGWFAASLCHHGMRAALEPVRPQPAEADHPISRLVVMATSLMVPAALLAVIAPTSDADVVVRTVVVLALAVCAVIRLFLAISAHARAQERLLHTLHRDELTGLPNRTAFVARVAEVLEDTWRTDRHPTLIQLNLDRFKNINDSIGRSGADRVLVMLAERLAGAAAPFGGVVARSGGDDFVVIDGSTASKADAMHRVAMIRDALASTIEVNDTSVFVTASIGVAIAPHNRTISAEELLRRADIATFRAKTEGRNRVALFDESMQQHLSQRMDVEHALHGAIGRREMRLYHQPIVDIVTGQVAGFEALMRWQRTEDSLLPPSEFVSIAEDTGIICELGAWALQEALGELRRWIDDGVVPPTTTTSVNVSPRQIIDPNFTQIVRDALDSTGISPHLLWIEMTESMMLDEPERAQLTLRQIRAMGVRLALDDFGTGYSSLSLLQQFPIQRIKIDRAFVQGIAERSNDRSLVRTIIAMAQSMGLDLVAEGVETVHQLQSLRDLGCNKAQGYLISHPVPPDAMRSTMVALAELTSLSLFGPNDVSTLVGQEGRATRPLPQPVGGGLGARPIGQPMV